MTAHAEVSSATAPDRQLSDRSINPLRLRLYFAKRRLGEWLLRAKAYAIARKYRDYTMVRRRKFIDNLLLVSRVRDLPGCVVECGVWRGGMSAGIAEMLGPVRHYYLFDSFEGLPPAKEIDGTKALNWQRNTAAPSYYDNCSAEISVAKHAMAMSRAERVTFKKGWFNQTLPGFTPDQEIAVLRLDGDWYDSTMECLEALYHRVVPGGMVILDDYYMWDGCARAVHDFLSAHKLADRISQTRAGVCYIVRRAG